MLCGVMQEECIKKRRKDKMLPSAHIQKYKNVFPVICEKEYQCVGSGCGCLSDNTLIEVQSQDELVRRVKLPRHAVDDHSQCDYLIVSGYKF